MIVVDTNVLVYAVGAEHPLREPSRRIIDAAGSAAVQATTTAQVIHEFLHVYARRRSREEATAAAKRQLALFEPLLTPADADVSAAIDLYARHAQLDSGDALLAAIVLGNPEVDALVTADQGFAAVPGLALLDPRGPEIARMLA